MSDKLDKRKENAKPVKLFSISAMVWCDGLVSGQLVEYLTFGRMKNQKQLFIGEDAAKDFLSTVRSQVPSAIPTIEGIVETIQSDASVEDTLEAKKIGKVNVDIYNDSYVEVDFCELVQGSRGAPKAWRLQPRDFVDAMESLIGTGNTDGFKALGEGSNNSEITV